MTASRYSRRVPYSAEVEQALAGHPGIADCAVVGIPHPEWGDTIVGTGA